MLISTRYNCSACYILVCYQAKLKAELNTNQFYTSCGIYNIFTSTFLLLFSLVGPCSLYTLLCLRMRTFKLSKSKGKPKAAKNTAEN